MRRTIISLSLALSGCTLVTGGLTPPTCMQNDDCQVLNEINGIAADACMLYQCSFDHSTCELSARDADRDGLVAPECAGSVQGGTPDCNDSVPSGTEICNGIDDDCDGIIDEHFVVDGVASNPLPAEPPETLIGGTSFSANGNVGYGTSPNAFAVAYTQGNVGTYGIVSGASPMGPTAMGYLRSPDPATFDTSLVDGCFITQATSYSTGTCNFGDAALGLTSDNVFATTINLSGCGAGQVRVGYFPRSDAAGDVIQRGPLRRSNTFGGIDVVTDGTNACTGASRSSGVRGATRPAMAAMDLRSGPKDEALAVWIADTFSRDKCAGDPADVEALLVHVDQDASNTGWVTGSNEGIPQVLGQTTQGGRPGVATWDNTGYIVGFAAPEGGIHLVFVATMTAPPMPGDPTWPSFTSGTANDRTGVETAPFVINDLGIIETQGQPNDIAIAFGSILTGGIELGIAWREGCEGTSQTIRFRQLFLTNEGASIDESKSFAAIDLTPAPSREVGPPAIAYSISGMIEQGVERADGRAMGNDRNDGGWIVAWADKSNQDPGPADDATILARRVSEADGQILSPDELLVLNAPGDVERLRPVLYVDADDRVLYGFLALGSESGFRGAALTCVP